MRATPSLKRLSAALAATAILAGPALAEPVVVCLGDSLTEGYQVSPEHAFPSVIERRLRDGGYPEIRIVNAGISGSTSASAVSRLKWQMRAKPDLVVLALGANDGLRGISPETTKANLAAAIDHAAEKNVAVLLAGMKMPPNYGPQYTEAFERVYSDLAKEKNVPLIPFLLDGVAAQPELNLPDGIHPNAAGYKVVAKTVLRHLRPLLEQDAATDSVN